MKLIRKHMGGWESLLASILSPLCRCPCHALWQMFLDPCGRSLSTIHCHIRFLEFPTNATLAELHVMTLKNLKPWSIMYRVIFLQIRRAIYCWIVIENWFPTIYGTHDLEEKWVCTTTPKLVALNSYEFD
jgi:hypothetical protein